MPNAAVLLVTIACAARAVPCSLYEDVPACTASGMFKETTVPDTAEGQLAEIRALKTSIDAQVIAISRVVRVKSTICEQCAVVCGRRFRPSFGPKAQLSIRLTQTSPSFESTPMPEAPYP